VKIIYQLITGEYMLQLGQLGIFLYLRYLKMAHPRPQALGIVGKSRPFTAGDFHLIADEIDKLPISS
jgi:hypothetical protein